MVRFSCFYISNARFLISGASSSTSNGVACRKAGTPPEIQAIKHEEGERCPSEILYPKLIEIQLSRVFKSLYALSIELRESFGRLLYVGEAGHDNNDSSKEH